MKHLYYIIFLLGILSSCSENERMTYSEKPGVYFPDYVEDADSLVYSFLISQSDEDVINIQVKLLGALLDTPGKYKIVVSDKSTAVAGHHYEALPETFEFPAATPVTSFPIKVLKPGTELDDKIVTLELALEPTEDLDLGYLDRVNMRLMITNQIVKPSYWDMPLALYFGEYSQAKHLKCIELMGHDFPLTADELMDYNGTSGYRYWMNQGRIVCQYYATHEEYDENGNRIEVWTPF